MPDKKRKGSDLPKEIIEEILLRLPVKSLIRFKCVSRTWSARFQNPSFIRTHYLNQETLDNAESRGSKFFLKGSDGKRDYFASFECRVDERDQVNMEEKWKIFFPFLTVGKTRFSHYRPRVCGLCNGIICLNDDEDTALWNPATREFRFLPPSKVIRPRNSDVSFSFVSAFGYDHKTNDYKVLRLVANRINGEADVDGALIDQLELYSLKKNEWREIHSPSSSGAPAGSAAHDLNTSIDGVYHNIYSYLAVVSFDLVDEVFTFTTYPDELSPVGPRTLALAPFNKCLAAISYVVTYNVPTRAVFDVWVLKEIGVMESWTKELTIGPIPRARRPLGFWKKRLFVETWEQEIAVYNPISGGFKILGFKLPRMDLRIQLLNYVESLVPIYGRSELEEGIVRSLL